MDNVWWVGEHESVTVTVTLNVPDTLGVPVIAPVVLFMVTPVGRPEAE